MRPVARSNLARRLRRTRPTFASKGRGSILRGLTPPPGTIGTVNVSSSNSTLAAGAKLNVGLQAGGGGLNFLGNSSPAIALGSGDSPATLKLLNGGVSVSGNATGVAQIVSAGSGAIDGTFDLGDAQRTVTVAAGNSKPELLVATRVINGGIVK